MILLWQQNQKYRLPNQQNEYNYSNLITVLSYKDVESVTMAKYGRFFGWYCNFVQLHLPIIESFKGKDKSKININTIWVLWLKLSVLLLFDNTQIRMSEIMNSYEE